MLSVVAGDDGGETGVVVEQLTWCCYKKSDTGFLGMSCSQMSRLNKLVVLVCFT